MNDNQFDNFLRQQLHNTSDYIDDGDFSARVMGSLPAPKRLNPWLERFIVCLPVTLIALLVVQQFSPRDLIQSVYAWVLTFDLHGLLTMAAVMVLVAVIAPLFWLLRRTSFF